MRRSITTGIRLGSGLIIGFIAGVAPGDVQAQETTAPGTSSQPAPNQAPPTHAPDKAVPAPTEPARDAAPPKIEFLDRDGKPLPPELQRRLREQLKKDPPPIKPDTPAASASNAPRIAGDNQIVVTGKKPRGSVVGDIPPAQTFNPLDLRAYGASDINELLQALGPQLSSNRGREDSGPVVLLNGKRVSSLTEISKIPTEAIERFEVFPEELALKYGYRADQKVVNIVTFEHFKSRFARFEYVAPTDGGRDTKDIGANYLLISGNTRYNFDADYSNSGALLESERNILQAAGTPNLGRFRTLLPSAERLTLNGTVSGELLSGVSSTLNGRFEANNNESLLGLGNNGPLSRNLDTHSFHLGTTLDGRITKWSWSFTANYDRVDTDTLTDTNDPRGTRDSARSVNSFADANLLLSGAILKLPSGPISTSIRIGGDTRNFSSRSSIGGLEQIADLSRNRGGFQVNLDVPIASQREKILPWLGNLSVNANFAIDELSDFGALRTFGYGLNWSPIREINLIASATNEEGAPTVEQLGAPLVVTPNVPTFDFTKREVRNITRLFGGNPNLRADRRHVVKLGINAKPVPKTDLTLSIDYVRTRIDDPIASFPIATPQIEAAFPERFARDLDGQLLRIDGTPLNFARSDQEQIRWGINFIRPLGAVPPGLQSANARFVGSEADLQKALPPGARIIKPEPGSPEARRFENVSSRLTLSLYYTLYLADEILTRKDGLVLDLLNGAATGARGGSPRHKLDFQAGAFKKGLGARLTASWQSGSTVRGFSQTSDGTNGDLIFSSLATVNINLFANLADRFGGTKAPKWLKGTRLSISVNNLLNSRPKVRDEAGLTPISYQPAYLDPLGRFISFNLRKVF